MREPFRLDGYAKLQGDGIAALDMAEIRSTNHPYRDVGVATEEAVHVAVALVLDMQAC